jgi:hypothetical protein
MLGLRGKSLVEVENKIKKSFSAVREEMEDHLVAINENTDELKSHSDFMNELDRRIEALNEKIESVHLMLMQSMGSSLNENEKKILNVLDRSTSLLSCKDIAFSAAVSELFVKAHLFSMICKGIPLKEKVIDSQSYFELERKTSSIQTVMIPQLSTN